MRKKKQHFVIFRDANNRKLTSLAELKAEGVEADESTFKTAVCNEIVSNKVGANKKARREVRAWTQELKGGEKPAVVEEVSEKALAKKVAAEKAAAEKAAAEKLAAEAAAAELAATETAAAEAASAEAATIEA